MSTTSPKPLSVLPSGGAFLLELAGTRRIGTPEDFTEDQRQFYRSARKFATERVHARARGAVLAPTTDPSKARAQLATLCRLLDDEPGDVVAWRETVVAAALDKGKYPLAWT